MYTFALVTVIVLFISKCFFKNNFWENRYVVLLIIASVGLFSTLAVNYKTRNNKPNIVKTIWTEEAQLMNIESLFVDSNFIATVDTVTLDDFKPKSDTIQTNYFIYKYNNVYQIVFKYNDNLVSKKLDKIYIGESDSDKAFYSKERLSYDCSDNPWVIDESLPNVKTYKCIYLPHNEFIKLKSSGMINDENFI